MKLLLRKQIQGSAKAFEIFEKGIKNGAKVLGLATGSTPEILYQNWVKVILTAMTLPVSILMNMSA